MSSAGQRYDIYEVFDITDLTGVAPYCSRHEGFWHLGILRVFEGLPVGVRADAVSVDPRSLPFEEPILIVLEDDDLEGPEMEAVEVPA